MSEPFSVIAEAFSRTGEKYDAFGQDHPHLNRMRRKVYTHLERFLPRGSRILEINAGTGIDAVELAQRGYSVHATDIATGMLERARDKIQDQALSSHVTLQVCSFTCLDQINGGPYDAVFSNLGGLNCLPDLRTVIQQLHDVLLPGGLITWVLMPRVCLWELVEVLRGHPRLAVRRFARNGTNAHLEGLHFPIYYFTPRQVKAWFGPAYECLAIEGLSVLTPTAESKHFVERHPNLYRVLTWLDDRVAPHSPWYGWGDFFILTMRQRL
jgi:ubiquinone/menaquinone biosynthesis C-methylase UbiE